MDECTEILYSLWFLTTGEVEGEIEMNFQQLFHGSEADRLLYQVLDSLLQEDPVDRISAAHLLTVRIYLCSTDRQLMFCRSTSIGNTLTQRKKPLECLVPSVLLYDDVKSGVFCGLPVSFVAQRCRCYIVMICFAEQQQRAHDTLNSLLMPKRRLPSKLNTPSFGVIPLA